MPDSKTYRGGCHCGAVRYEATTDLKQVISCNCSICRKRGLLLTFVGAEQFALLSGQENLVDYQFGRKTIHHLFCSACGVESFARGTAPNGAEMAAINVRCLDDVDIAALTPIPFDGKDL
ncbi:GFA family protein [Rhodospirillaceae bacterium SYSU D60014]|uniref:GFA family protein n=1 Tax=Virgifigura deserti TaxID=2268457 RepID=UPI000E673930